MLDAPPLSALHMAEALFASQEQADCKLLGEQGPVVIGSHFPEPALALLVALLPELVVMLLPPLELIGEKLI